MEYLHIRYACENGVARIVLDRPDVLNALNSDMVTEIHDAAGRTAKDGSARALAISGAGDNFAAGADIEPMAGLAPDGARAFCLDDAFNAIDDLPVPVIAAIRGYCLGGGLELAFRMLAHAWMHLWSLSVCGPKLAVLAGGAKGDRLEGAACDNAELAFYLGRALSGRFYLGSELPKFSGLIDSILTGEGAVTGSFEALFTGAPVL